MLHLPGFLGGRLDRDDWAEVWRVYAGLVSLLDDMVGGLLAKLEAEGLLNDALVVFTSDHGEMLGSHRLWQKNCCYEASVCCPILVRPPSGDPVCPGRRTTLASHIDILPTLLDCLGVQTPDDLPGRSLRRDLAGLGGLKPRPIFIRYDGNGALGHRSSCVIAQIENQRLKLNVDQHRDETFTELYDLTNDPGERVNLAMNQPGLVARLGALWLEHAASMTCP